MRDKRGVLVNSLCNVTNATPPIEGTPVPAANESDGQTKTVACQGTGTVQTYCYPAAIQDAGGNFVGPMWSWRTPIAVTTPITCPGYKSFTDDFQFCKCTATTGATNLTCQITRLPDAVIPSGR